MKSKLAAGLVAFFLMFPLIFLKGTPDLALWTANKCSKCHINQNGGGIRRDFGWKFIRDASVIPIGNEQIRKIYSLFDKEQHTLNLKVKTSQADTFEFPDSFFYGMDFRLQSFRSHKSETSVRRYIPMEANIYFGFSPVQWINFNSQFNLGKIVFQGQDNWIASAILEPISNLPSIRFGKFQPSFGVRDCDMTGFDRRIANLDGTSSLFPPDYSELGVELSYSRNEKFEVSLGVFDSRFLSQVTIFGNIPLVIKHNPTLTSKVVFYNVLPLLENWSFLSHYFLGSSILINGNFTYTSSFLGVSFYDDILLYFEYASSKLKNLRTTENLIFKLGYVLTRGIIIYARFETAQTKLRTAPETTWKINNEQIVSGIKLFPIPYLELNAEYRFLQTLENKSLRWAFQIHLYY